MLDPRIEAVRQQYGLEKTDFWELPQKKGTYCVKHAALEVAAAKAGIRFDMPQIIEANGAEGVAAVCVRGELGDRFIWSIGECSPKNNRNAYPWAMAEKRAVDRVILKLIGIHGLVYSEDEMAGSGIEASERREGVPQQPRFEEQPEMANTAAKEHWRTISDALFACTTIRQLQGAWQRHYPVYQTLPEGLQKELHTFKDELKDKLMALSEPGAPKPPPPNFDRMETTQ